MQIQEATKSSLYGILWILANNLNMTIQTATIKALSHHLSSSQIVFLYKLMVLAVVSLWVCYKGFDQLKTQKIGLLLLRALLSIVAALLFVRGLKDVTLAYAVAVGYTEPLIATILAVVLFKEYLNKHCILALIIGFIGVLIILNPGVNFDKNILFVLAAAVIWGFDNVAIKSLGKTQKPLQYLFYISLFSTLFAAPFGIKEWKPFDSKYIPWIIALAVFYFIHLIAVFKAFQHANLSVVAPFDFSRVIFSAIIGWIAFNESISAAVIIGSIVVVGSFAYIIWNKEHLNQKIK